MYDSHAGRLWMYRTVFHSCFVHGQYQHQKYHIRHVILNLSGQYSYANYNYFEVRDLRKHCVHGDKIMCIYMCELTTISRARNTAL